MQGMSFGPADLAASRRMKTTRVGGGHPGYRVIEDPDPDDPGRSPAERQQDPWHYSIARMVDACTSAGILPFYGPYGDIRDREGCETQFRAAFLLGCVGAWSLHPVQIEIAKKVFSPDPDEVLFAKKVLEAIPDGRGVHMIDGKMQDDATWKQCKVMVELAEMLAEQGPRARRGLRASAPPAAVGLTPAMRISAKADYAVRAVVELAAADSEKPVKAERIATAQGIPLNFLENILGELRHAGIVRSHRGAEGGFRLAQPRRPSSPSPTSSEPSRDRWPASAAGRPRRPATPARRAAAPGLDRRAGQPAPSRRAGDDRRHRRRAHPGRRRPADRGPRARWVTR